MGARRLVQNRQYFTQFLFCVCIQFNWLIAYLVFHSIFICRERSLCKSKFPVLFFVSVFSSLTDYSRIARTHHNGVHFFDHPRYTRVKFNAFSTQRRLSFVLLTISGLSGSVQSTFNGRNSCATQAAA